ncbi:hypothetical protein [Xanthovirga aplysinae]|uniref:hypothetical protein n=1 Tax=Xanthovirga aplysinae TaxID=2529853 RepID=UPI001CA39CC3|nr:hypothetical protein [Xanthovirga aplysinae]
MNNVMIIMGVGISFSTLQDTTKTQNKMSRKIWESPKKGKIVIFILAFMVLLFIGIGLIGYFSANNNRFKDLSIGITILGVGIIGFLKSAIEMFENHRKDKNTTANII